jgi:hypothetical protein
MPILTTIQEFCREANDEQLESALELIQDELSERQSSNQVRQVSPSVQQQIAQDAAEQVMPRSMARIKRQVYDMLSVQNTPAVKRELQRAGINISELNLRTKSAWQSLWQQLVSQGYNQEPAPSQASQSVEIPAVQWRNTGVEIEFAPPRGRINSTFRFDVQRILRTLERDGRISSGWSSELDVSCGNEVVSPIIESREQFKREVGEVLTAIQRIGGRPVRKAGGHIHIDAEGYTGQDYLQISQRYAELYESTLKPQLMEYRINNRYCRVSRRHHVRGAAGDNLELFTVNRIADQVQEYCRYRAVNGMSDHNTIEYRQGACFLYQEMTMERILHWVDTLQALHQHQL